MVSLLLKERGRQPVARSALHRVVLAALLIPCGLSAAVDNWSSTSSSLWGTAGNWSGGVPNATSTATFNTALGLQTTITLAGASTANSLSFSAVGGANAYTFDAAGTVNTNTLTLTAGIVNSASTLQTFYNRITLAGAQSWTASSGGLTFNGNVNLGAGANTYALTVNGANAVAIAGVIANGGTAAGTLTYSGTSSLTLTGANTYTGATTITSGTVNLGSATALGTTAAGTTLSSGATLALQGGITVAEGLTVGGSGASANTGAIFNRSATNTLSGGIVQTAATTYSAAAGTQLTLSGALTGNFPITYGKGTATGTLVVSGSNGYVGATAIDAGTVNLRSANALGTASNTANTTVANGAVLQLSNNITLANTGTMILNGAGVGSGALQNLSGNNTWASNLTVASSATIFSSVAGSKLTIGNGTTYASLFSLGTNTVTFDGPGDIWLNSSVGVSGDTGSVVKNGTGKLTFYGYNSFYTGSTTVNAGSLDLTVGPFNAGLYGINGTLTIGAGASNAALAGTVAVNIASNSYVNQLSPTSAVTINSDGILNVGASTGVGSLTLNGGRVAMGTGAVLSPTGSFSATTNSAHLTSLVSGGQVSLSGATTFNVDRDASLSSDLTVSSVLAGGSINKQGTGVLTLSATNTVGGAAINAGVLNTQATNALGTTAAVTVADGAALHVQGGVSLGQTSTILNGTGVASGGALRQISGNNTVTGAVTLGSASWINADAGVLTLAGGLSTSNYDLTVGGAGTTVLAGAIAFGTSTLTKLDAGTLSFTTSTNFSGGTVRLDAGTLALNGVSLSIGTLHITGDSILDFGNSVSSNLSVTTFIIDAGVSLTINNWVNAIDTFYAQNWNGATFDSFGSAPMNQITFSSFSNTMTKWVSSNRMITPVPEPSTYGACLLGILGGLYGWTLRRRVKVRKDEGTKV